MEPAPQCPRCGYDLSGQVATWHAHGADVDNACCPLEGTCSECGLRAEWRLVMRPELAAVPWFVESVALHRRRYCGVRTWVMAMVPWMFWRRVRLETVRRIMPRLRWMAMCWLVVPVLALLATWMSISAINTMMPPMPMVWNGTAWVRPPATPVTFADVMTRWVLDLDATMRDPFATLAGLCEYWANRPVWTALTVALAGFPLMMLVLPYSRAASKVQMGHVWRAAVYAVAPFVLVLVVLAGLWIIVALQVASGAPPAGWTYNAAAVLYAIFVDRGSVTDSWTQLGIGVWFLLWWGCAFKVGFRMHDWWAVLLATFVPVAIGAVLGSALLRQSF